MTQKTVNERYITLFESSKYKHYKHYIVTAIQYIVTSWNIARERAALKRLDLYLLDDIGITEEQRQRECRRGVWVTAEEFRYRQCCKNRRGF